MPASLHSPPYPGSSFSQCCIPAQAHFRRVGLGRPVSCASLLLEVVSLAGSRRCHTNTGDYQKEATWTNLHHKTCRERECVRYYIGMRRCHTVNPCYALGFSCLERATEPRILGLLLLHSVVRESGRPGEPTGSTVSFCESVFLCTAGSDRNAARECRRHAENLMTSFLSFLHVVLKPNKCAELPSGSTSLSCLCRSELLYFNVYLYISTPSSISACPPLPDCMYN